MNWRDRQEVSDSVGAFADVVIFIQKSEFCYPLISTELVFL